MTDIRLNKIITEPGGVYYDIALDGNDLGTGNDLVTAGIISLLTNARAPADLRIDNEDRQGWWADIYREHPVGSLLWTLSREKATSETLRRYEQYSRDALAWMILDGIAKTVTAKAVLVNGTNVRLSIDVTKPDGSVISLSDSWAWDQF